MNVISAAIDSARVMMPNIEYRLDEPMKDHTSFRVGAPVFAMFFPRSVEELTNLSEIFRKYEISPLMLGNGTNLLVDDKKPLDIAAVKMTGINDITQTSETAIRAGAGASLAKLAAYAKERGLTGLEFAHGIPGTLGGAISMNAGAYGSEMKDIIYSTDAFGCSGAYTAVGLEHEFSYRHSRFSNCADIVVLSHIQLEKGDCDVIEAKMDELAGRRRESQPLEMLNAGSTFKRPPDGYAAALIEQAGLKGFSKGGAQISEKHSGFIVNKGAATFADIMAVIEHVRDTVFRLFGVELETEYKIVRN